MKFSQQLKALERQAPDEWCASFRLRHRHARNQFRTSCAKVHACTPGLPPISPVSVDCDGTRRRGKFLHYKQLKKLIKTCRNDRQRGIDPDQMEANDRRFFKQLQTEVKEINACALRFGYLPSPVVPNLKPHTPSVLRLLGSCVTLR